GLPMAASSDSTRPRSAFVAFAPKDTREIPLEHSAVMLGTTLMTLAPHNDLISLMVTSDTIDTSSFSGVSISHASFKTPLASMGLTQRKMTSDLFTVSLLSLAALMQ